MSEPFISLRNVDLHYVAATSRRRSLRTLLLDPLGSRRVGEEVDDVHALKSVSLNISGGERVGLLGHNGAGKSTLLKAIAGLYPLSGGTLQVEGEIRSLFELSLGFEPDATGRENILYRGLLLGLTPAYMRSIEAEIVEFAGLGKFIDYPVKTYSAGMQVRLAFAISTSVKGDILLLDEVLGAGDARFMLRAKRRIEELIELADIMILASHDLGSLEHLCHRGLVLHGGELVYDGPIGSAICYYNDVNGLL